MLPRSMTHKCTDVLYTISQDFWNYGYGKKALFASGWHEFHAWSKRNGRLVIHKRGDTEGTDRIVIRSEEWQPMYDALSSNGMYTADTVLDAITLLKRGLVK